MDAEDAVVRDLMLLVATCETAMLSLDELDPPSENLLAAVEGLRDLAAAEIQRLASARGERSADP